MLFFFCFFSYPYQAPQKVTVQPPNYTNVARNADRVELQSGAGSLGLNVTVGNASGDMKFYNQDVLHATVSSAGEWTYPLQPAFQANISSDPTNVTGNSTPYTLACNQEVAGSDRNSDYNTGTFTFTPLVSGLFSLIASVQGSGFTGAATLAQMTLVTSNRTYFRRWSAEDFVNSSGCILQIYFLCDMDANDTATATFQVNGEAGDVIDITGTNTWFQGWCLG